MMYRVEKYQIIPFKKLGVLTMHTYEKAFRVADRWIESMKDSYSEQRLEHLGPDYFYTLTQV